jgi:WD40 repeat protein
MFSRDGSKLASGSDDCTMQVWDVATGQVEHTLKGHSSLDNSVVFSHDWSKLTTWRATTWRATVSGSSPAFMFSLYFFEIFSVSAKS